MRYRQFRFKESKLHKSEVVTAHLPLQRLLFMSVSSSHFIGIDSFVRVIKRRTICFKFCEVELQNS